ncbi:MAG: DUF2779 domain-containing protein [bacterium]
MIHLSKTNYILWRECAKNAWLKIHKPDIYFASELTDFEKQIIETGNEVDELAREIFSFDKTQDKLIGEFQKKFEKDNFLAITDVYIENKQGAHIYEVKATNDIDKKTHYHDLAFQVNVLKLLGINVKSANLVHLNSDYVRMGDLNLKELFEIENVTEKIEKMLPEVLEEMKLAQEYLTQESEPKGPCDCIYKGRSGHCSTFAYSNPDVPEYSVHDLARIGLSKKKLIEIIDSGVFHPHEIPEHIELSDIQKNQIWTHINDQEIISRENIGEELEKLVFPLYFFDYETYPAAIPRFDDFSPYQQIPFQYSLHILETPESKPAHLDFLYTESRDPSKELVQSLQKHIGLKGSIIVWHKNFEAGRNDELAKRIPKAAKFLKDFNKRIYDLEDIFKKQHFVHKNFRGSSSIKKILPVLVPALSYKELEIREGGSAAESWNRLLTGKLTQKEKREIVHNLKEYCKLDTYAMYAVWLELYKLIQS